MMAKKLAFPLGLILVFSGASQAYEFTGARWGIGDGESVEYHVSRELSADMADGTCLSAIQAGYDVWTNLTCSYMSWAYAARTDNSAWGVGDGENVVSWRESGWDDSSVALAITSSIWGGASNSLTDTDIKFNGVHHSWSADAGGRSGGTDVTSVAAHEVGHAIGLDHSDVAGTTMWPSTGPGDTSGRTLHEDDMEGACALYPRGGPIPEPVVDPERPPGEGTFGDDCAEVDCAPPYFCIASEDTYYCSEACMPGGDSCPSDHHCAYLSDGSGACVRGDAPMDNRAAFGEACGNETLCAVSLVCIRDSDAFYCSGPCVEDECPNGYFCASLSSGQSVCARGERREMDERPGFGEPCTDRGLCDAGLFCLTDALYTDLATGSPIPYCSESCADGICEEGYRCVDVPPRGTACQRIPSAGDGVVGDQCWVDPERPWLEPTCGGDLICVGAQVVDGVVVERGTCTKNCDATNCCPEGWACAAVTPIFAQCQPGNEDSAGFECTVPRGGIEEPSESEGDSGGCALSVGRQDMPVVTLLFACLLLVRLKRKSL